MKMYDKATTSTATIITNSTTATSTITSSTHNEIWKLILIGILSVLGIFTRFTFIFYGIPIGIYFLYSYYYSSSSK